MSVALSATGRRHLDDGLDQLDIAVDARQHERLLALVELLHKWNRAYNLTAIRSPDEMVAKHLLDSAAVAPYVTEEPLLDVGAGPGLPGLVLAILAPQRSVTLLDSNGKKVRFQRQAVMELGLDNVVPVQARVEAFEPGDARYPQVISRAFASLGDFVRLTNPLVAPGGRWLAMKGPAADDELAELPDGVALRDRRTLTVPFTEADRQLLIVERIDNPGRR
ncbi:16S rRNA (guanine(527)-N(7))-methyltransferase RsmG [Billgrantia gudaonensis]|uniref:Ribosomal RNA small subunit methyltransferase G n=1 Tax=Billgrantia gudaonensis TaxID=376427 RepID=A0A1G8PE85_9GAMM|nr:16S rRNA (guanine(527)-N(7))-methyltransferase RsmG [Halomonas gudaonensis]SDI90737.1 16S rRNA (guanine527-N7)-methyltransferase [Halomonas gudaonensis]